jgi:hypothetical protein
MTDITVKVDRLVFHGLSAEMGREVGDLVRARLDSLASGADDVRPGPRSEPHRIADEVARSLWGRIATEREALR